MLFLYYLLRIRTRFLSPSDSASKNASASSLVFSFEKERRIVESAAFDVSPKETRGTDVPGWFDEQAEPLDTSTPFEERKWSMTSLLIEGRVTLKT